MESESTESVLHRTEGRSDPSDARLPRYRRLRRYLILITSVAALTPLVIMAVINYAQDTKAYEAECRYGVSSILSNTRRALKFAIEERRSAIKLVIQEQPYERLASDVTLTAALTNLRNSFGGFVDLGVIESDGSQLHYSGPYELKGINYSDQEWFHEVVVRGVYVSDVFLGHRNLPHFVIAYRQPKAAGGFYILRATIDMDMIYRHIYSLDLDRDTDAFLINRDGVLQTTSAFFGDALQKVDIDIPPHTRDRELILEDNMSGQPVTLGFSSIEESPFILVVMTRRQTSFQYWLGHRAVMLWFLVGSMAMILMVVTYSAYNMTNRLHQADLRRAKIFHNVEYTSKMATLGRMAASVAHEINNPLAIINEKAGLMKDMANHSPDFPNKEKALKLINSIEDSVQRCSRVTHRLLGFGRRMDIAKEKIVLSELLDQVLSFQTTEVSHRNIQINIDAPSSVPAIESDRGQLQQVFLNIISNAIAAVGQGGLIDISVAQLNSNEVAVTIADNGPGIPAKDVAHVFEPFFSTKGESGTGLGLSITKDIVEKLGGLIEVHSEEGHGTRFIVNLPVEKAD